MDKIKQWFPIVSFSMVAFLLVTSELIPIGILNQISADLSIHSSHAGLMIAVPGVIASVSAIFFPFATKSIDRKYVFLVMTLMMIVSNIIVYYCSEYYMIIMGRIIIGVAVGGFATLSITSCRSYSPSENEIPFAISMVMAGMTLATVIGLPAGIYLSSYFGWRSVFLILSFLGVVIFFIQLKWLPRKKVSGAADFNKVYMLISSSVTRKYIIISLLLFLSHFFCYSYISILFEKEFNLATNEAVFILCLFGVAAAAGNTISSRLNERRVLNYLFFSFLLFPPSVSLIFFHEIFLLYVACILWGLAFGVFSSSINIFISFHASNSIESAMPIFTSLIQITITLGAYLGGFALKILGINGVFLCSFTLFSICALIFSNLRRA